MKTYFVVLVIAVALMLGIAYALRDALGSISAVLGGAA